MNQRVVVVVVVWQVFLCRKRSTGEILALKRMRKKLIDAKGQVKTSYSFLNICTVTMKQFDFDRI